MSIQILLTNTEQGLIYSLVALGLYISYRTLDIADLTTDGSFTLGIACSAILTSLGHPVLGDPLYGPHRCPLPGLDHQLLHACRIAFDHPADGRRCVFAAEPPEEFLRCLEKLGGERAMVREIVDAYRRAED